MDPFLEHPAWFPTFHDNFVTYLQEAIQPRLPSPYYALTNRRVWVELSARHVSPDVAVIKTRDDLPGSDSSQGSRSAVAATTGPVVVKVPHEHRRETYLEVYVSSASGDKLVTSIELLSLANKNAGERNREQYLAKQREMLESAVNLVEIDLLRAGAHTTAVPWERAEEACGPCDYHVCVHRFDRGDDYYVYPIQLDERLPVIEIPLLPADASIDIDLQVVFLRTYDAGPYHRVVRYVDQEPVPPLSQERDDWSREWLARHVKSHE
jgi:hypothetical protein